VKLRHAGAAIGAAIVLVIAPAGASAAATPPAVAFAKELRTGVKAKFAKQAPALVLGKVICTLPKSGNVVRCIAHFADAAARANILYAIRATLEASGAISWSTTAHSCTSSITHTKLAC
jgi:hypothetical protein